MLCGSTTAVSQTSSDKSWLQVCRHMSRVFSGMDGETRRVLRTVSYETSQQGSSHRGTSEPSSPSQGKDVITILDG